MNPKPKIGILFITSGWFRDVGLQESSSPLSEEVDVIAKEIIDRLSSSTELIYHGIIYTSNDALAAAEDIYAAHVDGIIISTLMWCEDQILRAALKVLRGLPCVVCTFFPYQTLPETVSFHEMLKGSGSVGSLQISGFLHREGFVYQSVSGYYRDESVYEKLCEHCLAFSIVQRLRKTRCGVLPFRCEHMSTTFVDEFTLRKLYGIELKPLELMRFKDEAQKISGDIIDQFITRINKEEHIIEVDSKNLIEGVKYALAIEKVIHEEGIDILAMNDIIDEMHRCFGLRPCLANPGLSESGVVVSMEADIAAGIAMYILRLFTGESPLYSEIFTADIEKNALLMGHAGFHDCSNHDENFPVRIVPDIEYKNSDPFTGACTYFKYKPGPVTAVNCVYNGEKLRWTVIEGNSLPGPPKLEGNCHLFCRIEPAVKDFYEKAIQLGVSQHWIVVSGRYKKNLQMLCTWLNIAYGTIE